MKVFHKQIADFQKEILQWYSKNKRDLPWRKTRDPYKILVSEVMLQQTQVSRVIPKYEAWLQAFPTVESLAKAKTSEVLRLWSGLGYNRRALYLQKTAKTLTGRFEGKFPEDRNMLQTLPGIGEYTARAVGCFAFDQQIAVVDTNVRKVILIKMLKETNGTKEKKVVQGTADMLLPQGRAYEWNQALMDYAASVLKKEKVLPRSGISLRKTKQSRFQGSNRYYRGQILKLLLREKIVSLTHLGKAIKPDFSKADSVWFDRILIQLEKDGFIKRENNRLSIA